MLSSMCFPACCRAEEEEDGSYWSACIENQQSGDKNQTTTFVEVQLLVLLLLLLLLDVLLNFWSVVLGDPLDLPARLLPLPALIQWGLGGLLDEVISLCLGENSSALTLQEKLKRKTVD